MGAFGSMNPVTFDLVTADGSAIAGSDYVAGSWTGVTIPAGQTSATVTLDILGDTLEEGYEGFNLYVSNVRGARADDTQALVMIASDDAPPALAISNVTTSEGNGGTKQASLMVSLWRPAGTDVPVRSSYSTTPHAYKSARPSTVPPLRCSGAM